MTIQNQENEIEPPLDRQPSRSASQEHRLLVAIAQFDGTSIGVSGYRAWGWDRTGMWEKHGRVRLSASFDDVGRLEDATLAWEHIVVGHVQGAAFNVLGHQIDNPRDTSGDLRRVLTWIENIETILGQPSIEAAAGYVQALEDPDHRHAWILWDPINQIAHCTDWFCQARFYPASGVLGTEVGA